MRPMKLAGSELLFGKGSLEHLRTLKGKRAVIVTGGSSMAKSGILDKVKAYLADAGMESLVIGGVEPDPLFSTVWKGAQRMREFGPDWIVALGGGSAMDAAKAMWVFYEHPELKSFGEILPPNPFPRLRLRARLACVPSTSGSASEVSRSIVITDDATRVKQGLGNMEMMPDVAICDPEVTLTMPPSVTAETGMDALTHALEALVSRRANYLSHILASAAARDIIVSLPRAYRDGGDLDVRETLHNASMTAGLAFTNVSLGIAHSMAHTLGSFFGVPHGLADAVVLPVVIRFNSGEPGAKRLYDDFARSIGAADLAETVASLNRELGIPADLARVLPDRQAFLDRLDAMARLALEDGCTKTNPRIPDAAAMARLFLEAYGGEGGCGA